MNELSCPKCKVGTVQHTTVYIEDKWYEAFGCNKCHDGHWEPVIDMKTYTISSDGIVNLALRSKETADTFAKDISEMPDAEVEKNVEEHFSPTKGIRWNPKETLSKLYDENVFLKSERERLIKKLEKIDNLSRYAWEQVKRNPQEAEELFKMINRESK